MKLCEECGIKPANIHLTQISQNETTVLHLCEECARKKGVSVTIDYGISESKSQELENDVVCPECRMKFSEFRERGRLGCSYCYRAFEKDIDDLLHQMHGTSAHKGKQYRILFESEASSKDLEHLRSELDNAIRNEKFELAAVIRDKISGIKSIKTVKKDCER